MSLYTVFADGEAQVQAPVQGQAQVQVPAPAPEQQSQQQAIYLASAPKMPAPYCATEKAIRLITPRGESSMK